MDFKSFPFLGRVGRTYAAFVGPSNAMNNLPTPKRYGSIACAAGFRVGFRHFGVKDIHPKTLKAQSLLPDPKIDCKHPFGGVVLVVRTFKTSLLVWFGVLGFLLKV